MSKSFGGHALHDLPMDAAAVAVARPRIQPDALLEVMIESIPSGLCIFDHDLKLVISNGRYGNMYGLGPEQIPPGTSLHDILAASAAGARGPLNIDRLRYDGPDGGGPRATPLVAELGDGSVFTVSRHPMLDGGLIEVHRDITDARFAEARAEAARQELIERQYAIDQAVIVAITDLQGRFIYANDNFCKISGYSRDELLGQNHRILKSGEHPPSLFRELYRRIARGQVWRGELCNRSKDGSLYWVDTVITPQLGPNGKPAAYMAIRVDVTARKRAEAQVVYAARHDALTGIANRAVLLERIEQALQKMQQHDAGFAVFLVDLDGFKNINDTLGHAAGDALLKELAYRLKTSLRDAESVARLGGDEFAIVQEGRAVGREEAIDLASRVMDIVSCPFELDGQEVSVGTSIGIALAPVHGTSAGELLKKADLALYRVKSEGRNGYSFFDEEMSRKVDTRLQLIKDMHGALHRDEFRLHYQPLFDAKTLRPCGMEALVRWQHPVLGLLAPDEFIFLAEETGFMEPLGRWILRKACADAAAWPDDIRVAVNLSASQFRSGTVFQVAVSALTEAGLAPERLELEITESLFLQNKDSNVAAIQRLKDIGVTIALDDFGTGYASLSYLLMFPFDKIKIDRSFTQGLSTRADCAAVVASILALAKELGISVTAEGVETELQFELLRNAGVDHVQGYLLSRPRPLPELDIVALRSFARPGVAA
ncbi:MAG: EAL domain-containing protein [Xanthobacteraceae bacterium]|nr:EAL domain-containing protein [Xanthobacteraceae bacterium]